MDLTLLKISAAGLLHDIGKFADRDALEITSAYINDNADLYQPFYNNHHTHVHSVYTAAFFEHLHQLLPPEFSQPKWAEGDPIINLAAGHHKPQNPLQWIIAIADRLSAGLDRQKFEDYNQQVS